MLEAIYTDPARVIAIIFCLAFPVWLYWPKIRTLMNPERDDGTSKYDGWADESCKTEHTPLSDVTRLAYDKHINPDIPDDYLNFVGFLEDGNNASHDSNDILSTIAKAVANYVDIYGVHELGEKQIRIEKSELPLSDCKNYFSDNDNDNSIRRKESVLIPITKPIWNNLHIKTDDIEKAL